MTDSAKLTHVVDVEIGRQMFDKLISGQPIALGFDAINAQVRIKFDPEVILTHLEGLTPQKQPTDDPSESASLPS